MGDVTEDLITTRLETLARNVEASYGEAVVVQRPDIWEVALSDAAGAGISVEWCDNGPGTHLLYVDVGRHSVTLHRDDDSVDYLEQIVRAAVTGGITESRRPGRSRLEIPLADGMTATESGYGVSFARDQPHTYPAYSTGRA
ncbi:hypothetical protein [Kribbella deserti]|uniref:Uncharacterized protein n=1 Tax=Kribbella deserti TaxID=1926257 RepID=A0ABV6QSK6_9ACTN